MGKKLWSMYHYAQPLLWVHALDHDHTDDHKAVVACSRGKVYPFLLTSSLAIMWLWPGSQLVISCLASLGFHSQRGDRHDEGLHCPSISGISYGISFQQLGCQILLPHVPHSWEVWFMRLFCTGRCSLQSRGCQKPCGNSPLTTTWQESRGSQKDFLPPWKCSQITPN